MNTVELPEAVAWADPQSFANFQARGDRGGVYAREWMWASPGQGLEPVYTAAQMLAFRDKDRADLQLKAGLWDQHRGAIDAANRILQAARPVILNLIQIEDTARAQASGAGEGDEDG